MGNGYAVGSSLNTGDCMNGMQGYTSSVWKSGTEAQKPPEVREGLGPDHFENILWPGSLSTQDQLRIVRHADWTQGSNNVAENRWKR